MTIKVFEAQTRETPSTRPGSLGKGGMKEDVTLYPEVIANRVMPDAQHTHTRHLGHVQHVI